MTIGLILNSRATQITVHLGFDHAGYELSRELVPHLMDEGYVVVNHGPDRYDPLDDYPKYCIGAARAVIRQRFLGRKSFGVVIGGSGNGEQIAANKVIGVRAALIWNDATAQFARQHNDANVAAIGARQHTTWESLRLVDLFLHEPFSGDERHRRRIHQLDQYEQGYLSDRA